MIKALSVRLSTWLLRRGAIDNSEASLFEYAAYSLMFGLLPVAIVVVVGSLSGKLCEGLIMITPFMLIRKFSGGYHLSSPIVCFILSVLIISGAILVSDTLVSATALFWLSCVVFAAYIGIFSLSPIDSESRRLTEKEKTAFRKIARILASIAVAVYFLLLAVGQPHYAVPVAIGIVIVALLQVPCIIHRGISLVKSRF